MQGRALRQGVAEAAETNARRRVAVGYVLTRLPSRELSHRAADTHDRPAIKANTTLPDSNRGNEAARPARPRQRRRGRELDRQAWLAERRAASWLVRRRGPCYDDDPYPIETQLEWVAHRCRPVRRTASSSMHRAAPVGTSRLWLRPVIESSGSTSQQACWPKLGRKASRPARRGRSPRALLRRRVRRRNDYRRHGEHPSKDWPQAGESPSCGATERAPFYVTVEECDDSEVDASFEKLTASGLPVVRGEVTDGDVAELPLLPGS